MRVPGWIGAIGSRASPLDPVLIGLLMHPRDFEDEARRLARPCTYLRSHGQDYAAVWGGSPVVAGRTGQRHWFSVDARCVPGCGTRGVLGVFLDKSGDGGSVVLDPDAKLPPVSGRALFAHAGESLPPVDAVFLFGSEVVGEWLSAHRWPRAEPYNDNFPDSEPVAEYEGLLRSRSPLYTRDAHAVLGSWHWPWPDGDWLELTKAELLAWTFADAEPWVEVWAEGNERWVRQRIT